MRALSVVEPAKRAIDALAQPSIAPYGGSCKAKGRGWPFDSPGLRPRLLSCARCAGFADNSAMLLQSRFVWDLVLGPWCFAPPASR